MGSGVRTDGGVAFGAGGDPMWGAAAQRRRRAARSADHRQQRRCHAADRAAPVITGAGAVQTAGPCRLQAGRASPAALAASSGERTGGGRSAHDGTGRPRTRRNRSDRGMVGGG